MSALELEFILWLRASNVPPWQREYRFAPPRRWRFDFAWQDKQVAVEIEGVTAQGGRHQRIQGFVNDCEKYEAALRQGWKVYRVPGQWIIQGKRRIWRREVMDTLKELLA